MRGTQIPQTCDLTSLVDAARMLGTGAVFLRFPGCTFYQRDWLRACRITGFARTSRGPVITPNARQNTEVLRASSGEPNKSGRGNSPSIQSTVVSYLGTFGQKSGGSAHQ